ncbi:TAXI family TRAP transporter solute-binding subunit [Bacillus sp. ISL-47]|uniref:TAXI family TRAP transporter solute-binding subunit n=1 Tax=Bacillus sp. ISL-47 TaxID=2819130 RepID=UPI001BEBF898|nr:TAXI family TRAP transporter solute-binding subunit [Bacillus sp. ISL-47]MBT2688071.1 TAXI family TRAP transporter solute-binding subunit [Bacillus sp. ISL-47]MBT2707919.1 TAXI family TRAP transporter solute-binding subunit [Pseudomonas sp. ISL-84]
MKKQRNLLFLLLAIVTIIASACGSTEAGSGKKSNQFLTIATASTGGTYYPIGVGMGNLWSDKLKDQGIKATGQSSAGSVENIDLLAKGEAQLAILQGLIGAQAYEGRGNFDGKPYKELRTISMLWPNVEHFVLMDNQIKSGTIADIEGNSFSVGPQASGTEQSTLVMMEALGLTKENIKPEYLGYDDTISAMRDGRLDGGSLPAGVPVAAITDMYASGVKASVLDVTDEQLDAINSIYNTWYRFEIPAGTYPKVDKVINTIAQPNFLAVSNELDEETVYTLTKTLYENLDEMYKVHNSAKNMKLDNALDGLPAPLHIGAYKYFKEEGLEIPENLVPPEAK